MSNNQYFKRNIPQKYFMWLQSNHWSVQMTAVCIDSTWASLLISINDLIWGKEGNRLSLNLKIALQFSSFIKNVVERKFIRAKIIHYWRAAQLVKKLIKQIIITTLNIGCMCVSAPPAFSPQKERWWLILIMHKFNMDLLGFIFCCNMMFLNVIG